MFPVRRRIVDDKEVHHKEINGRCFQGLLWGDQRWTVTHSQENAWNWQLDNVCRRIRAWLMCNPIIKSHHWFEWKTCLTPIIMHLWSDISFLVSHSLFFHFKVCSFYRIQCFQLRKRDAASFCDYEMDQISRYQTSFWIFSFQDW
jgi:hypothetical protein